jgi:murein DD-endopeptidase MepM/ murein hydrolase activator NlpD
MRPPQTRIRTAATAIRLSTLVLLAGAALAPAPASGDGTWPWPVEGEVVTAYENGDDPYAAGQHRGIDIAAPEGQPVVAATAGTVTFAGTVGSAGLTVAIRTADDRFDTSYLHLDSTAVEEGDQVEPGEEIGAVGTSGVRSVKEPHLHFGVRVAGEDHAYRDPLNFLGPPGTSAPDPPTPIVAPPRPGPLPAPGPAPLAPPPLVPVAAPKGEPAPRGAPSPAPAPHPRPTPRPLPGPAPRPAARPHPGPVHGPEPAPRPANAPEPAGRPGHAPGPAPVPSRGPRTAPGSGPAGAPLDLGRAPEAAPAGSSVPAGGGLDVGWALAILGVAVAGVATLRPAAGRALLRRAADAVGGMRRASWHRS